MATLTTDFTGSYDWPAEEAKAEAESFNEYKSDYSDNELNEKLFKLSYHWVKVFGENAQGKEDMARFTEVFNSLVAVKYHI